MPPWTGGYYSLPLADSGLFVQITVVLKGLWNRLFWQFRRNALDRAQLLFAPSLAQTN